MEDGAAGGWAPGCMVELHLCIARALQKLPQLRQRALPRKNEDDALHKKNESDDGEYEVDIEDEEEGKAKEAVLSEVEPEVELEEHGEEAEHPKGEEDFLAELADLEEEWRRETTRMAKRFVDLRHSCQLWKERERERLRKQVRREMSSSLLAVPRGVTQGSSALDLFIETLLSLREEKSANINSKAQGERETKSDRKELPRRTKAKKRTKATKPESEGASLFSFAMKLQI